MTALLALITVVYGDVIPLPRPCPACPTLATFYVTVGNIAFAAVALSPAAPPLLRWREFWLPFAGAWSGRRELLRFSRLGGHRAGPRRGSWTH